MNPYSIYNNNLVLHKIYIMISPQTIILIHFLPHIYASVIQFLDISNQIDGICNPT